MSFETSIDPTRASLEILEQSNGTESEYKERGFTRELQQRCGLLVKELEEFDSYVRNRKTEQTLELRTFKNDVLNESRLLDRLLKNNALNRQKVIHAVQSSNFPFYDAVWAAAKRSKGIVAIRKRFYWDGRQKEIRQPLPPKSLANSAVVDIVSEDGRQWTKVSTITEKKVIYDLTKAGWVHDSSDESDDTSERREDESKGLLRQVECLVKASKANKCNYRWPRIDIVLTRIGEGCQKPVQDVLRKIRALDVQVILSENVPMTTSLPEVVRAMAVDPYGKFSDVLNMDCTMLLAFVSDLSHGRVEPKDWHHKFLSRQMEMESKTQLLPDTIWPACGSKKMVCTLEAFVRMSEIVCGIGTAQEKTRARLLMEVVDEDNSLTKEERLEGFQELSQYRVPREWCIPIAIVDSSLAFIESDLPPMAREVIKVLSPLNQSVFLYGWATGLTTISSNRVTVKDIKNVIESKWSGEEVIGPDVWLSPMSRSLVGKEKRNFKE